MYWKDLWWKRSFRMDRVADRGLVCKKSDPQRWTSVDFVFLLRRISNRIMEYRRMTCLDPSPYSMAMWRNRSTSLRESGHSSTNRYRLTKRPSSGEETGQVKRTPLWVRSVSRPLTWSATLLPLLKSGKYSQIRSKPLIKVW